jgi:hypothetical protein
VWRQVYQGFEDRHNNNLLSLKEMNTMGILRLVTPTSVKETAILRLFHVNVRQSHASAPPEAVLILATSP